MLVLQYRNKPKARETIKIGADIYLGDGVIFQLQDILDIDTAEGPQLDIIGKILDCPRIVQGVYNDMVFSSSMTERILWDFHSGETAGREFQDNTELQPE